MSRIQQYEVDWRGGRWLVDAIVEASDQGGPHAWVRIFSLRKAGGDGSERARTPQTFAAPVSAEELASIGEPAPAGHDPEMALRALQGADRLELIARVREAARGASRGVPS